MATVLIHDMTREQVDAFITWFRDKGEDAFHAYCQAQGLDPLPYVDCVHAPDMKKPDYDGSLAIEMYSLPVNHMDEIQRRRDRNKKDA